MLCLSTKLIFVTTGIISMIDLAANPLTAVLPIW
nr:MAG TPA: hypothetical protein [Caudoviricetes sp.]